VGCILERERIQVEKKRGLFKMIMPSSYIHLHALYTYLLTYRAPIFQIKNLNTLIEKKDIEKQRKKHFLIL